MGAASIGTQNSGEGKVLQSSYTKGSLNLKVVGEGGTGVELGVGNRRASHHSV